MMRGGLGVGVGEAAGRGACGGAGGGGGGGGATTTGAGRAGLGASTTAGFGAGRGAAFGCGFFAAGGARRASRATGLAGFFAGGADFGRACAGRLAGAAFLTAGDLARALATARGAARRDVPPPRPDAAVPADALMLDTSPRSRSVRQFARPETPARAPPKDRLLGMAATAAPPGSGCRRIASNIASRRRYVRGADGRNRGPLTRSSLHFRLSRRPHVIRAAPGRRRIHPSCPSCPSIHPRQQGVPLCG